MRTRFGDGLSEALEVRGISGSEMIAQRIDIVNAETLGNQGGKFLQIYTRFAAVACRIRGTLDVLAKRVGGYGQPLLRF